MTNKFKSAEKIICIFLLIIFVMGLTLAEEVKILKTDGVQYTESTGDYIFTLVDDSLRIDEEDYRNIQPKAEGKEARIRLDSSNRITEAHFTVNENGGVYVFGEDKLKVPPNSEVIFKDGKIIINAPKNSKIDFSFHTRVESSGTEIVQRNVIELKGKDLQLSKGVVLNEGVIVYQSGKPYVKAGTTVTVNGFKITPESSAKDIELRFGSAGIFSWLSKGEGNYVRFDKEVIANGEGFKLSFTPKAVIDSEKAITGENNGLLKLPSKGHYGKGDKFTSGKDFENVKLIQEIVGVKSDGNYGGGTERAVKTWQRQNGLEETGLFGEKELKKYIHSSNQGDIEISLIRAKAVIGNNPSSLSIDLQGLSSIKIGKETLVMDGAEISKKMVSNFASQVRIPATITLHSGLGDIAGSVEYGSKSKQSDSKPSVPVSIGSKTYSLKQGEAYIVTAAQTAFTKAIAPPMTAEELKRLPEDLRDNVAKAGHIAIMYVDNQGKLRVSESSWDGVKDIPFKESLIYEMRDKVSGVYGFANADSTRIIAGSRRDASINIGWFFTDVDSGVGTFSLNRALKKDYTSYRSCVGHVCTLASYGGVNLEGNSEYLPLQGGNYGSLQSYVQGWGIKDKAVSGRIAGVLVKSISAVDTISYMKSKVGLSPVMATPPQLIMGNLNEGIIEAIEPVGQQSYNNAVAQKLQSKGYEYNSAGILKFQKDYNSRHPNDRITEDGKWGLQCERAYYNERLYASNN